MTLQEIKNEIAIKGYVTLRQTIEFSEKFITHTQAANYDEFGESSSENLSDIYELLKIFSNTSQIGDDSDYHNYAILFGKLEDNKAACDILLCGLKKFPRNVDLLADFLLYALSSVDEHYGMCLEIYNRLLKIRKTRWTWRAFDFSICYLLNMLDKEVNINENELKEEAMKLAQEFQCYHPKSERGYVAQAKIMKEFGDKDEDWIAILLLACGNTNMHAPRSAMKLAEISFEKKEYDVAIKYFHRLQSDQIDQVHIISHPGQAYMLSFLTKTAQLLQENLAIEGNKEMKQRVQAIYKDYKIVKKLKYVHSTLDAAQHYIGLVEVISGITFNDGDDTSDL